MEASPDAIIIDREGHVDADADVPDRSIDAVPDSSIDASHADRSLDVGSDSSTDREADSGDSSIDSSTDSAGGDSDGTAPDAVLTDQGTPDGDGGPTRAATCTVDQPCVKGDCVGSSCDTVWSCFSHFTVGGEHPCPFETIPYCGCDGKTYFFPITCPEVPYLHAGACGDGVNCDRNDVRCTQPEPDCGPGRVASVVGTCYGACVPITSCRCMFSFECPHSDMYGCNAEQRCDVPVSR